MSRTGAGVYLMAGQYFVAEQLTAAAWHEPGYSWRHNYISDLGIVDCSAAVCSPQHEVMNGSFMLLGSIVAVGSVMSRRHLPAGRHRRVAACLMVASGVGDLLVGLFPGSVSGTGAANLLHTTGAVLAILGGNAGILLAGLALRHGGRRAIAGYSVASGLVGLVALVLFGLGIDLGLGIGTVERIAADPIVVWMVVVGIAVNLKTGRPAPG